MKLPYLSITKTVNKAIILETFFRVNLMQRFSFAKKYCNISYNYSTVAFNCLWLISFFFLIKWSEIDCFCGLNKLYWQTITICVL